MAKYLTLLLSMVAFFGFSGCMEKNTLAEKTTREIAFPEATYVQLYYSKNLSGNLTAGPRLNAAQISMLKKSVYIRQPDPDESFPACFIPHHFFRFFNASGQQISEVQVCFCCGGFYVSGAGKLNVEDYEIFDGKLGRIEGLVRELGVATDINCD